MDIDSEIVVECEIKIRDKTIEIEKILRHRWKIVNTSVIQ